MTYPAGVQLSTLTFSNPTTFLGNQATRTEVTVQASSGVVWAATGEPIDDFSETVAPNAGLPGFLTVPFVDQPGFTDQSGNAFTMWAYTVTRRTFFGASMKVVQKNWQPVMGQSTMDFDNLPGGNIGLPVSAPIVPVTSVAGETGVVQAEALADALAGFLPIPSALSRPVLASGTDLDTISTVAHVGTHGLNSGLNVYVNAPNLTLTHGTLELVRSTDNRAAVQRITSGNLVLWREAIDLSTNTWSGWEQVATKTYVDTTLDGKLVRPVLASGTDLNTIYTAAHVGTHGLNSGLNVYVNAPNVNLTSHATLEVSRSSDNRAVVQRITSGSLVFWREAIDSVAGTWSPWEQVATKTYVDAAGVAGAWERGVAPTAPTIAGYTYGDSWNYGAPTTYANLLKDSLWLSSMTNRAVSGNRIQNVAVDAQAVGTSTVWTPGTKGLVLLGGLLNPQNEGDNTTNRDTALESMRAVVARFSSAAIREDNDTATFTYNGTWSTFTDAMTSGGTARYVSPTLAADAFDTATVTVNVPAGVNYLQFIGLDPTLGTGATFVLYNAGSVEVARTRTDGRAIKTPTKGIGEGQRAPVVMRVPGTAGGTFTLKVTTPPGYAGQVFGYVDCMLTLSDKPPMVVALKPPHVLHPNYQNAALETYLRTVPDTVAAEFSNVIVADANAGFDTATMLLPDLLHPLAAGQTSVATQIKYAINSSILRRAALAAIPGTVPDPAPIPAPDPNLRYAPTGALGTTMDRRYTGSAALSPSTSGTMRLSAVWLPAGSVINSITYVAATAGTAITNRWFALFSPTRALLGTTADNTATWASGTALTSNLTTPYTVTTDGLYYVGICETGTTSTSLRGIVSSTNTISITPNLNGDIGSGTLTNAASTPNPAPSLVGNGSIPYAYVK